MSGGGQNEAFSRVLIDKALEFSHWNLLDAGQVQFEHHTESGRADRRAFPRNVRGPARK